MKNIRYRYTFKKYINPIAIIDEKFLIRYINPNFDEISMEFYTSYYRTPLNKNFLEIFKLKENDKFKIRKYISENFIDKNVFYLNYNNYNFYLKFSTLEKNRFIAEFLPSESIDDFITRIYEESSRSFLEEKYLSADELNKIYLRNDKIISSIKIYNEVSALFIECKNEKDLFYSLDKIIKKMLNPESFDYLEIVNSKIKHTFSRNSILGERENLSVSEIDYVYKSLTKLKKPLLLPHLQKEISNSELNVFPGIKNKTSAVFIPVIQETKVNGIAALTFNSNMYNLDDLDLKIMMGITNLAYITIEKIRKYSEKKAIENRFDQQEKMIAMGNIIAGVAHEINNPLSIMQLDLDDLKDVCKDCKNYNLTGEMINSLSEEIKRISLLVQQLKEYARPDNEQNNEEIINVDSILKNYPVKILIKSLRKEGIDVEIINNSTISDVKIPKTRFIQVIMNLLTNAAEALKFDNKSKKEIKIHLENEDENLVIHVMDTGEGISEENWDNIFVPFYTTKKGDGTGLGLSISYSIMKKYSGDLYINKLNKNYTDFVIMLPQHS